MGKVWISEELADRERGFVGFRVQVFIPELSRFKPVSMSVAEALEYGLKTAARDIEAVFFNRQGEEVHAYASYLWGRHRDPEFRSCGIAIGTYSREVVCCTDGYPYRAYEDGQPNWYNAIGESCYECREGGMNAYHKTAKAFSGYDTMRQKVLNRFGVAAVRRRLGECTDVAKDKLLEMLAADREVERAR